MVLYTDTKDGEDADGRLRRGSLSECRRSIAATRSAIRFVAAHPQILEFRLIMAAYRDSIANGSYISEATSEEAKITKRITRAFSFESKKPSRAVSGAASTDIVPPPSAPASPVTLFARSLSFGKKGRSSDNAAAPSEDAVNRDTGSTDCTPRMRILSFGKAKGPQTLEVDVFKATPSTRLGLTLQPPEDETVAGVVIAHIDANAPLREAKKLLPGDIVTSVNCVPVASLSAVSAQIQQASGVLRFEVLRRPLPAGWRTKYVVVEGEIRIRYRNKKLGFWTLSHPHARHTHTKETMEASVADSDSEDEAHVAEPPMP
jgi:hypothetical protein